MAANRLGKQAMRDQKPPGGYHWRKGEKLERVKLGNALVPVIRGLLGNCSIGWFPDNFGTTNHLIDVAFPSFR